MKALLVAMILTLGLSITPLMADSIGSTELTPKVWSQLGTPFAQNFLTKIDPLRR